MNPAQRALLRRTGLEAEKWCSDATHSKYPHVFTPLTLQCGLELRNRIVMGSMHTGLEEHTSSNGLEAMAQFYKERASGGAGLIVTGGVAPNREGWVLPFAGKMTSKDEANTHKVVTKGVHESGGRIAMQILHAGRYAYHPLLVGPSKKQAPINVFQPKAMTGNDIERTIRDFAKAAYFAQDAGYDGVEIMGSEGYLINEFLAPRTNDRSDEWGGSSDNRARFPLRIVDEVRKAVNKDFALIFRLSLLELVNDGFTFPEAVNLAFKLEDAGVDILNTGIGWHEARVPTIATCVPRAAFAFPTAKLKAALSKDTKLALCATNRINDIQVCEDLLTSATSDLCSMARPFLADPDLVAKAFLKEEQSTNTCIACNQACLDHTFKLLPVSCLVNPRAGHETDPALDLAPTRTPLSIAVVGAGVAGLACSTALAARGHKVTLFEQASDIGGQFNLAANVPGKEEFKETLRYFRESLTDVDLRCNASPGLDELKLSYDKIVIATGVIPRSLELPFLSPTTTTTTTTTTKNAPRVRSYADVLRTGADPCGANVAVIGAGGIGFDVAEALVADGTENFYDEWGIDTNLATVDMSRPKACPPKRHVYLLQRKNAPFGATLGKTTGWIRRATLKHKDVTMLGNCSYVGLDDGCLVIEQENHKQERLPVSDVVICAGQVSNTSLLTDLQADPAAPPTFVIGGAEKAAELDAKRAIDQGFRLAAHIDDAKSGDVFTMPTGWKASALDFLQSNFAPSKKSRQKKTKKKAASA